MIFYDKENNRYAVCKRISKTKKINGKPTAVEHCYRTVENSKNIFREIPKSKTKQEAETLLRDYAEAIGWKCSRKRGEI